MVADRTTVQFATVILTPYLVAVVYSRTEKRYIKVKVIQYAYFNFTL